MSRDSLPQASHIVATTSTPRMWAAAWLVTAVFMLSNSPTPLYVHWQAQMGFSSGMLTVIFSLYIAGLLGTLLVAGQLSDHYGRKRVLLPGMVIALVASGLFAGAGSVGMLAAARLLTGIAVGVIVSAGMAAVVDAGGELHKRFAALLASVAMVLGAGLGPLLAGGMTQVLAHPVLPIFALEALVLLSALAVVLSLPSRSRLSESATLRLRLPHVPAANRRQVLAGIATFGPGLSATSFVLSLGPSLLARLLDVDSPLLAGGMACAMFFTAVGIQFAVRQRSEAQNFAASAVATMLSMLGLVVAIQTSVIVVLIGSALLAGAGQGLGQLAGLSAIARHVPDSHRAQANAVLNMGAYIPAGLFPVAAGYLMDAVGMTTGSTLFAVVLSAVALAGGTWAVRHERATGCRSFGPSFRPCHQTGTDVK